MRELFVYYRVRIGSEASASKIVDAFQAELRQQVPSLVARLLRRSEEPGAAQTWMETYAMALGPADEGISATCQQTIEAAARPLAPCIDGSRHTEVFVPVARA